MTSIERDIEKSKSIEYDKRGWVVSDLTAALENNSELTARIATLMGNRRERCNGKLEFHESDWRVRWAFRLWTSVSIKIYREQYGLVSCQ